MLLFSTEEWLSSAMMVLLMSAWVVSAFRYSERQLLYRHLLWLQRNRPEVVQVQGDRLPVLLYRRKWLLGLLMLFLGSLAIVQTIMVDGYDHPSGLPFWGELRWPMIVGLQVGIMLQVAHIWKINASLRQYERINAPAAD